MMKIWSYVQKSLLILTLCGVVGHHVCADEMSDAQKMIQNMGDAALQDLISTRRPLKERQMIVRKFLRESFDVDSIARFTMGTYWRSMTDEQKKRLHSIFEDTIVQVYTQRFEGYDSAQFSVVGAMQDGRSVKVSSEIRMLDRSPLKVDWKVFKTSRGLRVLDVFVDGISMSITQRSEFGEIIQKNGGSIDRFMDVLAQRISS